MTKKIERAITLKFGGSEATNIEGANYHYLYSFISQISDLLTTFDKIGLIIGGGPRIRKLQATVNTNLEKDLIARQGMWEHAETLAEVARQLGLPNVSTVPKSAEEAILLANSPQNKVIPMSWLKAGQSSDTSAILMAKEWIERDYETYIVILSNVLNIFTADPKTDPNAKAISTSNIDNLIAEGVLLNDPNKFIPGMNVPIDPVAVSILEELSGNSFPNTFFGGSLDVDSVIKFINNQNPDSGTVISHRNKKTIYKT